MDYLFLDESGDCSFSPHSIYKHFVITIISVDKYDMKKIKNHLKRVFADFYNQGWQKTDEVKASDLFRHRDYGSLAVRRVIESLTNIKSLKINYFVIKKDGMTSETFKKAPYGIAYNYFTGQLLTTLVFKHSLTGINLTFDKRNKETHQNKPFQEYVTTHIMGKAFENNKEINLALRGGDSSECYGLVAADFLSWAIFRHYEFKDSQFFNLLEGNMDVKKTWYI